VVSAIKECSRRASEFGVTIGVQNHHDLAAGFESQYDMIAAVDEPNCKALFDAWAPALHGADLGAGRTQDGAHQRSIRPSRIISGVHATGMTPRL